MSYSSNTYINVTKGEELQKALEDGFIRVIILGEGEYNLKEGIITIAKDDKIIIGNKNTIFTNGIIIKAKAVLNGVKFSNKNDMFNCNYNIFIDNNSEVELVDIQIDNVNAKDTKGIVMNNNSKSMLHMYNSIINNVEIGIEVNSDNVLGDIINNKFYNFKEGITSVQKGASVKCIKNNIFKSRKDEVGISFSTGVNIYKEDELVLVTNGTKFARELSLNNNYAFVKGDGMFSHITTECYKVNNQEKLNGSLKNCDTGNIIILEKGLYYGNIVLDKQVALIGEESLKSVIVPRDDEYIENPQYGIIISSDNIFIKDISINGKGNCKSNNSKSNFRDGIRYSGDNLDNNQFINVNIKNIQRRGISIWPNNSHDNLIENCVIENIEKQACIYFNGSGVVKDSILKNSFTAIEGSNYHQNKKLIIDNNVILNNVNSIIVQNRCNTSNEVKIMNNHLINNSRDIQYKNSSCI